MVRVYQRRKVTPKVRGGVVQRKNNHTPTAALGYVLARQSPRRGYRHLVSKQDIRLLTSIIPGWRSLSEGLETILLTAGDRRNDGVYEVFPREKTGSIQIPAWEGELWRLMVPEYAAEHEGVLAMLGVAREPVDDGVRCRFTLPQAKAFLLLHVFLHELGHHVDRMTSKAQAAMPRGEPFAEAYAHELCAQIWPNYVRLFGDPRSA